MKRGPSRRRTSVAVAGVTALAALGVSTVALTLPPASAAAPVDDLPAWTSTAQSAAEDGAPVAGDVSLNALPPGSRLAELPEVTPYAAGPAPRDPLPSAAARPSPAEDAPEPEPDDEPVEDAPAPQSPPPPPCAMPSQDAQQLTRRHGPEGGITGVRATALPAVCTGRQVRLVVTRIDGTRVESTATARDGAADFSFPDPIRPERVSAMRLILV